MKGGQEERAHQERLPGGEDMQTDLEWIYTFQRICILQETRIFFKLSSSLHSRPASFVLSWVITLASSYPSHCSHTDGILGFSGSPSCLRATWNALSCVWSCLLHRFVRTHSSKLSSYISFSRKPSCNYQSKANRYKKAVNIFEKQSNHKSKTYNRLTKTKKNRT